MKHSRGAIGLLLALGMAASAALSAPVTGYQTELRRAVQTHQRRQWPQAARAFESLMKKYKDPAEVKEIAAYLIGCYLQMKQYGKALDEATRRAPLAKDDKDFGSSLLLLRGDALRGLKKTTEAIAAYRQVAKDYPDYADRGADALLRAADVYGTDLKKAPEALAVLAEVEKTHAANLPRAAEAARRAAGVHETLTKDLVKAAAFYQSLCTKYAAVHNEQTLYGYYTKAAGCLVAAKKLPEAQAVAAQGEKAMKDEKYRVPLALQQPALLIAQKKFPAARAECDRIVCAYPLNSAACQPAQTKAVEAWRAESKFAEALGAARILYGAAGSQKDIQAAAHVVAQGFRSVDGNLSRANQFLAFQRFGPLGPDRKPNTPDDVKVNHLVAARLPPADPARDKRFQAAIAAQPKTHEGYRAMGYLYVYWGRFKEGAQMFRMAFRSCPDAGVPQAAHELVLVGMKAHTGTFAGLDRVFEFISYGPKGKDGKQNIPDPFKGL